MDITCVNDLISEIKRIKSDKNFNDLLWFRGHSDKEWDLIPSIQRSNYVKAGVEQLMTNDFYMRACVSMKERPSKDYCGWITLMQHFGLPTRLLDWSLSPLIALFFATNDYDKYSDKDGLLWILRPKLLNKLEGFGSCIYPMDKHTVVDMIKPAFKKSGNKMKGKDKIIACYPVEYNIRIYTQQSAFTVHNYKGKITEIGNDNLLKKYIIPSKFKKEILNELNICGITLRNIYPDIEHIAQELKDFYNNQ